MRLSIQNTPFSPAAELEGFATGHRETGAEVSFTGRVRDDSGALQALEIEHYPGMTEAAISAIMAEAATRWQLLDCLVIHRFGRLAPGAPIMMVATAARHRAEAFAAAEYLMDYLKSRAPFWKREITAEGAQWVGAKASDEDALTRW
ncbi:molybdenum cofactor biosynthesis protein MoaE [Phaeovulum sp.]|uniref:molybdenum cofactor biosynthesis protein MoaE n=1 Tax=Phaeovulum sp. TaxID=2934796 RepID=UPI002731AAF9|nr:molybdenum cofactor biosynthesis protein MoaE [Phaeovulum sp.]MDP1669270.1 molybdenum cofactor biosynthesis protein MoaE [Phaeovulum sp.]MDZ4119265.1 molybdenum cofactor biosynthesis protein MoaE [Phaeovulum sp.]